MDDEPVNNFWSIEWSEVQSSILMLLVSLLVFILLAGTIIRQNASLKETITEMQTQCLSAPNKVDEHQ
jgi:hypothetical protein